MFSLEVIVDSRMDDSAKPTTKTWNLKITPSLIFKTINFGRRGSVFGGVFAIILKGISEALFFPNVYGRNLKYQQLRAVWNDDSWF